MRNLRIRAGIRVAVGIAAVALPLAVAGNASATVPGDNGDVKIHDITTGIDIEANNPHVCKFYLDAFNFDPAQKVHWEIDVWAGSDSDDAKGTRVAQGDFTLKADGSGHTAPITLPNDHYKLFWTFDGENGKAKHKVFWVDCGTPADGTTGGTTGGGTTGGGTTGGTTGGSTGGTTGGGTTTGGPTAGSSSSAPKASASSPSSAAPATTSPSAGSTSPAGNLAHTGADGSALIYAALGAAALAGSGYGLRRYAGARSKG